MAKSLMINYCLAFSVIVVNLDDGMIYCSLLYGRLMGELEEVVVMGVV